MIEPEDILWSRLEDTCMIICMNSLLPYLMLLSAGASGGTLCSTQVLPWPRCNKIPYLMLDCRLFMLKLDMFLLLCIFGCLLWSFSWICPYCYGHVFSCDPLVISATTQRFTGDGIAADSAPRNAWFREPAHGVDSSLLQLAVVILEEVTEEVAVNFCRASQKSIS